MTPAEAAVAFRTARSRAIALLDAPPPLLLVSDFDGTLSPLSLDPMGAVIEPTGRLALRRLAGLADRRPGRLVVAMLSGRLASDVAGRVRVGGLRYLGNHGLEGGSLPRRARASGLLVAVEPSLARFVAPAAALASGVAERLGRPGWLFVELKGPSVAFHFRQAPDPDAARELVVRAIEAVERSMGVTGLVQFAGRRIVELRPAGSGGKGVAMARLLERERPGAALVMGDDRSDAEAFEAVAQARAAGRVRAGLAVGIHAATETPAEVRAAADVVLGGTRDAARLLSAVAGALEREGLGGR